MLVSAMTLGAVLLEGYVPVYLMVTLTVVLSWFYTGWKVYVPVMAAGIIFDLTTARHLGLTSIVLLIMAGGLLVAKQQFEWKSGIFMVLAGVLGEWLMGWYLGSSVEWWDLLFQGLLIGLLWWGITKIGAKEGVYLK